MAQLLASADRLQRRLAGLLAGTPPPTPPASTYGSAAVQRQFTLAFAFAEVRRGRGEILFRRRRPCACCTVLWAP